jgi:hypothetical protein
MNKLVNLIMITIFVLVALGGYWYLNPRQLPRFIRDNVPGFEVPSPKSPMVNFRPPQF